MLIFFDTEFTDLGIDPRLISIGLVSENGEQTFYAELDEGWSFRECNDFVRLAVLPLLEGLHAQISTHELTLRLGNWLEAFGEPVTLATDSLAWDWPWVHEIFHESGTWPENLSRQPLLLSMNNLADWDRFVAGMEKGFSDGLLCRHHALDDAKANRLGWLACGGEIGIEK